MAGESLLYQYKYHVLPFCLSTFPTSALGFQVQNALLFRIKDFTIIKSSDMFPSLSSLATAVRCIVSLLYILSATAFAKPVDSDVAIAKKPAVNWSCAGGEDKSAYGCATVTFTDRYNLKIHLSLKDTKGDSHPVYVWLRVYDHLGHTDLPKVPNHSGVGNTIKANQKWKNTRGRITGYRAMACVDDWGSDTCYDGNYVSNHLP